MYYKGASPLGNDYGMMSGATGVGDASIPWYKNWWIMSGIAVAVLILIIAIVIMMRRKSTPMYSY